MITYFLTLSLKYYFKFTNKFVYIVYKMLFLICIYILKRLNQGMCITSQTLFDKDTYSQGWWNGSANKSVTQARQPD